MNAGPVTLSFITDGRIPIDNNDIGQQMRRVAIGRKNWLFLGSPDNGDRAASVLTLIGTALRHDLVSWNI
jgi:transposase